MSARTLSTGKRVPDAAAVLDRRPQRFCLHQQDGRSRVAATRGVGSSPSSSPQPGANARLVPCFARRYRPRDCRATVGGLLPRGLKRNASAATGVGAEA